MVWNHWHIFCSKVFVKFDKLVLMLKKIIQTKDHEEIIKNLLLLYQSGKFSQIIAQENILKTTYHSQPIILNILGATSLALNKFKNSVIYFKKVVILSPNNPDYLNNLGIAYHHNSNFEDAIIYFSKALKINPNFADAYCNLGMSLKEKNNHKEAIKCYKNAIKINPNHSGSYNNLGEILFLEKKFDEARTSFKKAIAIRPDFAEAYYNLGIFFQNKAKLSSAILNFKKAIQLKSDYAEAYYNLGSIFNDLGNHLESEKNYNKAITIKPDFADAYNNLGITYQDQGRTEEAIEAFTKALSIQHDLVDAWNNIYFPLQATKAKISLEKVLDLYGPKNSGSVATNIAYGILQYRLHRGRESEGNYFDEALKSLSSVENIYIQNPAFDQNLNNQIQALPDKMVALVHLGRSGTGLLHSLIDGHPEVSTLPCSYFSEYFAHSTWEKIISAGWDEMVDRFISIYEVLFDASSPVPIETAGKNYISTFGRKNGMTNVGDERNEVLSVDKTIFRLELNRLMACYDKLDAFIFFKLVHAAFDKAINDQKNKDLIFYHIHNPGIRATLNFVRFTPETNWIVAVREPIQSCESWIREKFSSSNYFDLAERLLNILFGIDNIVYKRNRSVGVRLEDIKEYPQKTLRALCDWMGIEEVESLYEMTAQGKKWWGDPSSPDYSKDGMDPFGMTSINRKVGSIFSENDQFILRTLFYPFSVRFGYVEENTVKFKEDLQKVRHMIDQMFDFEKKITEKTKMSFKQFMSSGSYLYLRSGLIERWNTLNELNTYPNMIKPLKI